MSAFVFVPSTIMVNLIFNYIWQAAVVSFIGVILLRFSAKRSAPVRSLLGVGVFITLMLLPLLTAIFLTSNINWLRPGKSDKHHVTKKETGSEDEKRHAVDRVEYGDRSISCARWGSMDIRRRKAGKSTRRQLLDKFQDLGVITRERRSKNRGRAA